MCTCQTKTDCKGCSCPPKPAPMTLDDRINILQAIKEGKKLEVWDHLRKGWRKISDISNSYKGALADSYIYRVAKDPPLDKYFNIYNNGYIGAHDTYEAALDAGGAGNLKNGDFRIVHMREVIVEN